MVFLGTGLAQATDISGTISVTKMISTDSRLTGDVRCTVTTGPCIQFGAPGIELKLNGHSMTGNGSRDSCTANFAEAGIDTNGQNKLSIKGPGLVTRFNGDGILVSGDHTSIEGVTITSSCINGIQLAGSHNEVERNSVSRASLGGGFFAGIFVSGTGGHSILNNEVVGAGPWPITSSQEGHGIFVGEPGFPSKNNLIQENNTSGNPGVGIVIEVGSTGNTVLVTTKLWGTSSTTTSSTTMLSA